MNRFQFVADHSDTFEVKRLCELVEVERSSFYAWQAAAPARTVRAAGDAQLAERIRVVHDGDNTCGAPRITAELNDTAAPGERVNHKGHLKSTQPRMITRWPPYVRDRAPEDHDLRLEY